MGACCNWQPGGCQPTSLPRSVSHFLTHLDSSKVPGIDRYRRKQDQKGGKRISKNHGPASTWVHVKAGGSLGAGLAQRNAVQRTTVSSNKVSTGLCLTSLTSPLCHFAPSLSIHLSPSYHITSQQEDQAYGHISRLSLPLSPLALRRPFHSGLGALRAVPPCLCPSHNPNTAHQAKAPGRNNEPDQAAAAAVQSTGRRKPTTRTTSHEPDLHHPPPPPRILHCHLHHHLFHLHIHNHHGRRRRIVDVALRTVVAFFSPTKQSRLSRIVAIEPRSWSQPPEASSLPSWSSFLSLFSAGSSLPSCAPAD